MRKVKCIAVYLLCSSLSGNITCLISEAKGLVVSVDE